MKKNITHFTLLLLANFILAGLFVYNQYDNEDYDYWAAVLLNTLIISVPVTVMIYTIYRFLFTPVSGILQANI